jgi:DNA-binding transcriptional LysR family regulator
MRGGYHAGVDDTKTPPGCVRAAGAEYGFVLDPRSLEIFYWVVRLGGFGRAAERLHTTQPAVSARIAALEARFGARLIERGAGQAPVPTAKGQALFAHAERLLALNEAIESAMAGPATLAGRLRLGVSETIVHTWLARLMRQVHAEHPALELDISVDVSPRLAEMLTSGAIDLAILLGPVVAHGARNIPLCEYEIGFAAHPDLPVGPEPLDAEALCAWPLLTYARTTRPHQALAELLGSRARLFGASSLAAIVRMAAERIGIAVLPPAAIAEELAAGRLRLLATSVAMPPLVFTASLMAGPGAEAADAVARLAVGVSSPTSIGGDTGS